MLLYYSLESNHELLSGSPPNSLLDPAYLLEDVVSAASRVIR